jgi:hypothetical protein
MCCKAVQQRRLVGGLVHPVRGVAKVGLTALVSIQIQGIRVDGEVLAHHPAERHDAGRVRWVALRRRPEVTVVLLVHLGQRVALDHFHLEGRHEGGPLVDATGPVLAGQVFETAAVKLDLLLVVFRRCDALELGAGAVELRRRTHGAGPAAVVPRHAYREVPQWIVVHSSLPLPDLFDGHIPLAYRLDPASGAESCSENNCSTRRWPPLSRNASLSACLNRASLMDSYVTSL